MPSARSSNYSNAKIYKLQCDDGHFYLGSTKNHLRVRFSEHKSDSRKHPDWRVYSHIRSIGWERVRMILVQEFPCESRDQLRQREDFHIQQHLNNPLCLNQHRSFWTPDDERDYYANLRRSGLRQDGDRKYYEQHREELLQSVQCVCGATVTRCGLRRHESTAKHRKFLDANEQGDV